MIAPSRTARVPEGGFVIVGVVMLVLALTILGLSLFSLSSFESQFLSRSLAAEQAFQAASGGVERAKFAIGATGRLEAVASGLPVEGVVGAVAAQVQGPDTVTTGPVQWGGADVQITVTSSVGGESRVVQGSFRPEGDQDFYRRLLTVRDSLQLDPGSPAPRCGTVLLEGAIWSNATDLAWQACQAPPSYQPLANAPAVPVPQVASFIAARSAGPVSGVTRVVLPGPPPTVTYSLHGPANAVTFYAGGFNPVGSAFTVDEAIGSPTISVQGIAVWLLPRGAWFFSRINVIGGPNDALVLVAGRSGDLVRGDPDAGVWLRNAVDSPTVPVILVSDGKVLLENANPNPPTTTLSYASIFAPRIFVSGPETSAGTRTQLFHAANAPQDAPGGLIDRLVQADGLPNATASSGRFSLVPGTWRELGN